MITPINEIYKRVAEKHGYDYKFIKSIGDHTFAHAKSSMLSFKHGSIYVTFLGTWVVKSVRIERFLKRYLEMRAYKKSKYPGYEENPISKRAKMFFDLYRNIIIPFKKEKKEVSKRQVEFAKQKYESYNSDPQQDGDQSN